MRDSTHSPQYGHRHFTILLFIFVTNHMNLEPENSKIDLEKRFILSITFFIDLTFSILLLGKDKTQVETWALFSCISQCILMQPFAKQSLHVICKDFHLVSKYTVLTHQNILHNMVIDLWSCFRSNVIVVFLRRSPIHVLNHLIVA